MTRPQLFLPIVLDPYVLSLLAHPATKQPVRPDVFPVINGVLDARVFLRNTYGYFEWAQGQEEYESGETVRTTCEEEVESYLAEIAYDRPVYEHFRMAGAILDVGGGAGTVREFLPESVQFVSVDPYVDAPFAIPPARRKAYTCFSRPLNFIAATAEFLPFLGETFDWVHMRSMLDHVQVPDLAILEAWRVLKPEGRVLIGLYVEGGKSGRVPVKLRIKRLTKKGLEVAHVGFRKDYHMYHPTYRELLKLIEDNGLAVEDVYWQPHWHEQVCYVCARKSSTVESRKS